MSDRSTHRRPTIGLMAEIESPYNNDLWIGLMEAATELDVNLIFYVGGTIGTSTYHFDEVRNAIYDLITGERVDGLLICGTIGNFITREQFQHFVNRYRPLPMIGISQTPGIPSVIIRNKDGMRALVRHFIETHGCRRIAFIRGPEENREAELRYQAYVETLAEHDLPLNPELITPGAFIYENGLEAIRLLVDERQVTFDAVVAANDWMAFGAREALEARDIRVPDDVAIGGFDDTREAAASHPSLTTVRQPIRELGRAGLEVILKLLAGQPVPDETTLPTRLIIRESCGCSDPVVAHAAVRSVERDDVPLEEALVARRANIISDMASAMTSSASSATEWMDQLLDAFLAEVTIRATKSPTTQGPFLDALDGILRRAVTVSSQVDDWQEVLSVMRQHVLPCAAGAEESTRVEDLFNQGRVMVGKMAQRNWALQELKEVRRTEAMSYLSGDLAAAIEMDQILDVVGDRLPALGFPTFYVAFYERERLSSSDRSRLMLAGQEGRRVELGNDELTFPSRKLVPDTLFSRDRRQTWVVESLNYGENLFGYIILETKAHEGETLWPLARQVSGALQNSLLQQKSREAERALAQQAEELARSNEELEQFAYIVSHDLQEPLRMVTSYLQLLERRYRGQLDADADDFIDFAVNGAQRMRTMINDLLAYSRVGTRGKPFEPTDAGGALDQALVNLQIAIQESNAEITRGSLSTVMADESQLIQLFQNLISNAIKFQKEGAPPRVHVAAERVGDVWRFSVADNGIGIDPGDTEMIFRIFQRLHSREEYEGTGIGLAVCRRIVERHGGQIWVESEPGEGSTFHFTIDVKGEKL